MGGWCGGYRTKACMSDTGAISTAPTVAIEVLLDIPLLHIFIQGDTGSVTHRLMQTQSSISRKKNARGRLSMTGRGTKCVATHGPTDRRQSFEIQLQQKSLGLQ